jgi:hypothetical protein
MMSPEPVNAKSQAEPLAPEEEPSEFAAPEPLLAAPLKVTPPIVLM